MNLKKTYIIFVVLLSKFTSPDALAQIVVTGHVTAEVVESVSAVSKAVTGFDLKNSGNTENIFLDLGNFIINSGNHITCNMILQPAADVFDSNGNSFTINPTLNKEFKQSSNSRDNNQTITINAPVPGLPENASGLYKGFYLVTFAGN